jgi:hypothetical protein
MPADDMAVAQVAGDEQVTVNIQAIRQWMDSLTYDARKLRPSKQLDCTVLERQGQWMDASGMFKVAQKLMLAGIPLGQHLRRPPINAC